MIMTSWGYTLLDVDSLPEILSVNEFNSMTANKYALDSRVASTIQSVTSSIRAYCGWHLATALRCELVLNAQDVRVSRKYSDIVLQLPFKYISSIEKVVINATKENNTWVGDECDFNYYNESITVYDAYMDSRKSNIVIIATVGLTDLDAIKGLIATKVSHILNGTLGVVSESAGGVSVSYSANFINTAKPNALLTDDKELLNHYKVHITL